MIILSDQVSKKQDLRKDTAENFERTVLCNRNRIIFFIERYEVGSESVILKFLHICISIKIEDTYFAIIKAGGLFNPDEVLIMVFRLHTVTIYIYAEGCSFRNVRRGEHLIFVAVKERAGTGGNGIVTVIEYTLAKLTTRDEKRILAEDINLKIRGSEKICIIGANGVGKTTLLRKIAEELSQRDDIKAEYMPQNYEEILDLDMTPVDFLDKSGDKEERTRIRTYLGSLKYTADEMEHPIRELSGGQKAKVLLLSMSLSGANVLILDEPTRNFSPLSGPVIRKMLREFPGAIISISHDRRYIDEVCDKIYELDYSGLRNL